MSVIIYHNPRCSKSRQTFDLLRDDGVEPIIVEYLETPLNAATLQAILSRLAMGPRDLMREEESREVGLDDPALDAAALVDGMVANPIILQRPIVVSGDKAALARPPEDVLAIL